jgi:hypothetical protein
MSPAAMMKPASIESILASLPSGSQTIPEGTPYITT